MDPFVDYQNNRYNFEIKLEVRTLLGKATNK